MLEKNFPLTLVTVVSPSDGAFVERFPRMLAWATPPAQVHRHIVVIHDPTREFRQRVESAFGKLPWLVDFFCQDNRWDLPAYNDVNPMIRTPYWLAISPDTRLFGHTWISGFWSLNRPRAGVIGPPGPAANLTPKDADDPNWGWIVRLLIERNLDFDRLEHVQTWCFLVCQEAFKAVGGFWETPDRIVKGKGDLIAAEVYFSVAMRRAGYEVVCASPHMHHYGTRDAANAAAIEEFDRHRGFRVDF